MGTKKILLVDDDPEDRGIIREAMEKFAAGDRIEFAENGEQALSLLNGAFESEALPCLVVLDLNMPRMNGTQTLRYLKGDERYKNIPVIIYSTSINPLEKEKCMTLGAHAYIIKPVTFNETTEVAHNFLRFCTLSPSA